MLFLLPPSKLLSLASMARRLRVTQRWLRGQADAGLVPCLKDDGVYLFDHVAVERALLKRVRASTPPARKGASRA
jgi:hypothetical protein